MKTLRDAAIEIGIGYQALRKRVLRGKVKAVKIGSQWVMSTKEIERLKECQKQNT